MGLTELFNEWIVERGSAKVQEKHIALFREQLAVADKKIAALEKEITLLKAENEQFKSDLEKSNKENQILREKIQEYEQPHNILQHNESIRILTYLAKIFEPSTAAIAQALKIEKETAKFYLHELEASNMVIHNCRIDENYDMLEVWVLEQEGRRYLIKNNLIT